MGGRLPTHPPSLLRTSVKIPNSGRALSVIPTTTAPLLWASVAKDARAPKTFDLLGGTSILGFHIGDASPPRSGTESSFDQRREKDQSVAACPGRFERGRVLGREQAGLSADRIRFRPVPDQFQTGFRPVPGRMHSPCHSVISVAQSCRMHSVSSPMHSVICTCLDRNSCYHTESGPMLAGQAVLR